MQKIAIVTRCMESGGAERVIARLIEYAVGHDFDMFLILMEDGHQISYQIPDECNMVTISCNSTSRGLKKFESYSKLRKIIKQIDPGVVLSMPEDIGIYVIVALLGTKYPVVVSERNNPWVMPYKKITRLLRTLMYPFADGLIFQTKQAAFFFSEKLQRKGIILPNPLDTDNLPEPYLGEREKIIIGAGRLDKQKNFPLLIDAFAEFYRVHTDYKLVIYGEGALRAELEKYIDGKRLPDGTITLPGRTDALAEHIRGKAMFVLSSDFEGMPNVVIEAMAVGTPVISTDCPSGGSAELITNGENGLLTPVGDVVRMRNAMEKLADDTDYAGKLAEMGLYVRTALDSTNICRCWIEYLNEVI